MGSSRTFEITPCFPPEGDINPPFSMWWKAVLSDEGIAYLGAYPWVDDSLCICTDPNSDYAYLEVLAELVDSVLDFASFAGFEGVYAITYSREDELCQVLDTMGFKQVGHGREWSKHPTTYWFRESL